MYMVYCSKSTFSKEKEGMLFTYKLEKHVDTIINLLQIVSA